MNTINRTDKYITPTYARVPLNLVRGEGCMLYDDTGKEYIDFTAGIGVNALGYNHQKWIEATQQQLAKLQHISNLYYTDPSVDLAEKLIKRTAFEHVFFANSGAEANELAIKTARKWGHTFSKNKHKILTLKNSFHGRTITTLAATGQDTFHQDFYPFTEGFDYVEVNNLNELNEKVDENVVAIMIEMIQGEGGVVPLEGDFLEKIKEITNVQDVLLIIDEIQTGIGRTGKFFSYEHFGLTPDIVTSAKGLGNGLPIGAVLFGKRTKETLQPGDHGTTFGGNPVAAAGAGVVVDTIDENFLASVAEKGSDLKKALMELDGIESVQGMGLMLGITFKEAAAKSVLEKAKDKGVLFLTAKDKLRLLPPLTIDEQTIEQMLAVLEKVLQTY